VSIVLKFGSLNLLEHSGPVQACNGIALTFFTVLVSIAEDVAKKIMQSNTYAVNCQCLHICCLYTFKSALTQRTQVNVDLEAFSSVPHFVNLTVFISTYPFGTAVLYLIQINHQPDSTFFQFIILTFVYSLTCFGPFPAHHQELSD
jgi:hypothetical protein